MKRSEPSGNVDAETQLSEETQLSNEQLKRLDEALAQMPRDLWLQVLMKLSIRDVGRMRRVSRRFNARFFDPASEDSNIWDTLLEREAPRETFEFLKLAFPKEADANNVFLRLAAFRASTRHSARQHSLGDTMLSWQWTFKRLVDSPSPLYRLTEIFSETDEYPAPSRFAVHISNEGNLSRPAREIWRREVQTFRQIDREILGALVRLEIWKARYYNSQETPIKPLNYREMSLYVKNGDRERVRLIFLGAILRILLPMRASLEEPLNIGVPLQACAIATCAEPARYTCGGCRNAVYCSAQCQARDWHENAHSRQCRHE